MIGLNRTARREIVFLLISATGEDESVLWVARALLLFCMNSLTDRGRTDYVIQQYIESTLALHKGIKSWTVCVCGGALWTKRITAMLQGETEQ